MNGSKTLRFLLVIIILSVFSIIYGCGQVADTSGLDQEIANLEQELQEARSEVGTTGGAIESLTVFRVKILENTLAMLEQRKTSLFYFVSVNYDFKDMDALLAQVGDYKSLDDDIELEMRELKAAEDEAARYSGGLLKSMALMRASTQKATIVALKQRKLLAKWNIPLLLATGGEIEAKPEPAGPIVADEDAL